MRKIILFLKKYSLIQLAIVILVVMSSPLVHGATNDGKQELEIKPTFPLSGKWFNSFINSKETMFALLENKDLGSANNPKSALEWSNQKFPKIDRIFSNEEDIQMIQDINNELRKKYLNRSELYENPEQLASLDTSFITATTEDIVLYANFTATDFGINDQQFVEDTDAVFQTMLRYSRFGIDHGYFLGSLSPRPLDPAKNEVIQIKLEVPAGTKVTRIGSLSDSQFILQREKTLLYTEKNVFKTPGLSPHIEISAELIPRSQLDTQTAYQNQVIREMLNANFGIESELIKLEPLSLNAGLVLAQGSTVANKAIGSLYRGEILSEDLFDRWDVTFTNGGVISTETFTKWAADMTLEERKALFNQEFDPEASGSTQSWNDQDRASKTTINFAQLTYSQYLTEDRLLEDFAATILHEFFHYSIHSTDSFDDRPIFQQDIEPQEAFVHAVEELKAKESDSLISLLRDNYAETDWEEFICEAFMAKFHPYGAIANRFPNEVIRTNRLLDNLFDFSPPTTPKNVRELEVDGDSVKFTFDHSSDNISVQKYNIYQGPEERLVDSYETEKDNWDLTSPEPGRDQENIEVYIEDLEQFTDYEFRVSAVDEAQNESAKSEPLKIKTKDTQPPELVGDFRGSSLGSTFVRMNWTRPTDNVGVTEAKIRRIESSSKLTKDNKGIGTASEQVFTVSGNINYFTDFTIEKGKTYTYSMTALDEAGNESARSNDIVIRTSEVDDKDRNEDKTENTSSSSTTLNWSNAFGGISASGFQIFNWSESSSGWQFGGIIPVSGSNSSEEVPLTPGISHIFVVIPVDEEGNPLDDGLDISVVAPPNPVEGIKVVDTKRTRVSLEWESKNSSEKLTGSLYHDIYRDGRLITTVDGTTTSYTDVQLTPRTSYQYHVVARVGANNQSEASPIVSAETLDPYHGQIIRLESQAFPKEVLSYSNQSGANVMLKPFVNDSEQFIKIMYDDSKKAYQLVNATTNEVWSVMSDNPTRVVTLRNDKQDTQYWILKDTADDTILIENYGSLGKVLEVDNELSENGRNIALHDPDEQNAAQQFQVLIDTEPPTPPGNLSHSDVTDSSVRLTWEGSTDNVGVSKYEIYSPLGLVGSVDGKTPTYVADDLLSATLHSFTVKAVDASGNVSLPSEELAITTKPKAPKNLQADNITKNSAVLTWDAEERPEVVTRYEIYQDGKLIETVSGDSLTYTAKNLNPATTYHFTVKTMAGSENRSLPSNVVEIETNPDPVIAINLSELRDGDQGQGYTFANDLLTFTTNANDIEYRITSNNETNRSVLVSPDTTTAITLSGVSIRSAQPITVKQGAHVTFILQDDKQNKLVATNGIGISAKNGAKMTIDGEKDGNNLGKLTVEGSPSNPAIGGASSTISISDKADIVAITNNSPAILSSSNENLGTGYLVSFEIIAEEKRPDPDRVIHVFHEIWTDPSWYPKRKPVRDIPAPQLENKIINIAYTTGSDNRYVSMNVTGARTGDIYNLDNRKYNFFPAKIFSSTRAENAH